jgi:hypothetical protein
MASTQPYEPDHAPRHRFAARAAGGSSDADAGGAARAMWRSLLLSCAAVGLGWLLAFGLQAWTNASVGHEQQDAAVVLDLDDASAPTIGPAAVRLQLRGQALLENAVEVTHTDRGGSTSTSHLLIPIVDHRWTQGEAVMWLLRAPAAGVDELRRSPNGPWRVQVEGRVPLRLAQAMRLRGVRIEPSARLLEPAPTLAGAR